MNEAVFCISHFYSPLVHHLIYFVECIFLVMLYMERPPNVLGD
jgi:hypothetical protein